MAITVEIGGRAVAPAFLDVRDLGFGQPARLSDRPLTVCVVEFALADVAAALARGFAELQADAATGEPPEAAWEQTLRDSPSWVDFAQAADAPAMTGFLDFMAFDLLHDLSRRGELGGAPESATRHVFCAFLSPKLTRPAGRVRINGVAVAIQAAPTDAPTCTWGLSLLRAVPKS
jgi:hypothetical protein